MRYILLFLLLFALPCYAVDTVQIDRDNVTTPVVIKSAAFKDYSSFATKAQGSKADSAVQSANYKVKNVLAMGIKGDGSDDGAALQALFNGASYGDVFYFPGGTYASSVQLNLPVGISFRIVGDDTRKTWFKALSPMRSFFFMEGPSSGRTTYAFEKFGLLLDWKADLGLNLRSGALVVFDNLNIESPKETGMAFGRPYPWSSSNSYGQYQAVTYSGRIFYSKVDSNLNHAPTVGGDSYWDDKEAVDTAKDNLFYQQKMSNVRIVSNSTQLGDASTRMPFGIRLYASANDSSITDTAISNAKVANVFDESAYTFYESDWLVGSPTTHGPTYGIWLAKQFGSTYDSGLIAKKLYFDGVGNNPGGGGAGMRLDRGGNTIQGSTFYHADGAGNGNYAFEFKNGITRTTIQGNRFDSYAPYTFQNSGTFGTEFVWSGNYGGDNPASPDATASKNIFPKINIGTQEVTAISTSVGNPGSNTTIPTEKAVRDAIAAGGGEIVYPAAGVPKSTGTGWDPTSYTVGTGASNLVQLNASSQLPAVSGALLTNVNAATLGGKSAATSGADTIALRDGAGNLRVGAVYSISATNSMASISDNSVTQMVVEKSSPSGSLAFIDFSSKPSDGITDASYRFGRNTNTTGKHYVQVLKGNNSSTANAQIGGNTDTYFAADNSLVGVGTSSPAEKLYVVGNSKTIALATPSTPTVAPQGTAASTTYGYKIVAKSGTGVTLASTEGTTATGNDTLSGTNFNRVTWSAVTGATGYDVYRTTGGATQGKIGSTVTTATNPLTFDDTGLSATGAVPTVNTTGILSAAQIQTTGTIDGKLPLTVTTATSNSVESPEILSGMWLNNTATAGAAVSYTLPTAASGKQRCYRNYTGKTGVITLQTSAAGQYIDVDGFNTASGGYVTSGGALADMACVVGIDATHWILQPIKGTWAAH